MRYFLILLGVLFFGALLLDKFVLVSNAHEKDTYIDDSVICTHIHEYPIAQHKAILDYCIDLHERGL